MKYPAIGLGKVIIYAATFFLWVIALIFLLLVIDIKKILPRFSAGLLILALINAIIAKAKNKSGLKWFLITFLLGPFTTVLVILF